MNLKKCLVSYKMVKTNNLIFNEQNYFGHCPFLEHKNYFLNINREHWMVCNKCKIKWLMGENLFSSWRTENMTKWKANFKRIKNYKEINF